MPKVSDIVNKKFSRAFLGYDMREVDAFLDELIDQIELYEREKQEMMTAMEYLLRELEQFDEIESALDRGLSSASEEPPVGMNTASNEETVVIENEVADVLSFVDREEDDQPQTEESATTEDDNTSDISDSENEDA